MNEISEEPVASDEDEDYIVITRLKDRPKLTPEEKDLVKKGTLTESKGRHLPSSHITKNARISQYRNRSNGQTGCKKPRKRKNAAKPKVQRNRPKYPKNERGVPTGVVTAYLGHLQSLKSNSFTARIEKAKKHDLSDDQKLVLDLLDPVPLYSLRYCNRIFCSGGWQVLKNKPDHSGKGLREIVFDGCVDADFRSMHFEIYRMLIRTHVPTVNVQLDAILQDQDIWEFMKKATGGNIEKSVFKVTVQALINGLSMKQSNKKLFLNDLNEEMDFDPENAVTAQKIIAQDNLQEFVKIVYRGVDGLKKAIRIGVDDAFGERLVPLTREKYRELKDIWLLKSEAWKLHRKDLNRLYSSYELRIMSETVQPLIGKDEFRVDLHLHDGILFSANSKAIGKVKRKMKETSEIVLSNLNINSELKF